jgi:hypothetical protein
MIVQTRILLTLQMGRTDPNEIRQPFEVLAAIMQSMRLLTTPIKSEDYQADWNG